MSADETQIEPPRCYGHVFDPAHQSDSHHHEVNGWPAHAWSGASSGQCQHCPAPVVKGDRYVCVESGIMHAKCVDALDAAVLNGGYA